MLMVIPDEGKELILEELFRAAGAREDFILDLFQNNETVDNASTGADFTPATFTGYATLNIARGDWDAPAVVANVGQIDLTTAPTWTCSGGGSQTVYGWILRGDTSGVIYCGQNFDTPRVMSPGATESLDPFRIKSKTFA